MLRDTLTYEGLQSECEISLYSISVTCRNRSPCDIQTLLRVSLNILVLSMLTQTVSNDALTNSYSGCILPPVPNDVNALHAIEERMVKVNRVEWAPLIPCALIP
ncbi:MAG: hypothetical protein ACLQVJ_02045 [Syntrophobacteraceae bacterium]